MRKLIFLDIDGVLNNVETIAKSKSRKLTEMLEERCISHLNTIIDACEYPPFVVLSSSWRIAFGADETFHAMRERGYSGPSFYDETPAYVRPRDAGFEGSDRAQEIYEWLDANKKRLELDLWGGMFVILDDANISGPHKDHHVQTSYSLGLTKTHVENAIHILHHGPLEK